MNTQEILFVFIVGFKSSRYPRPQRYRGRETSTSSRGIIPKAKIRTIKMTIVIVMGT